MTAEEDDDDDVDDDDKTDRPNAYVEIKTKW